MNVLANRPLIAGLGLAAAAALVPPACAAATSELVVRQMTDTGPECTGGGSYYPSIDAKATKVAFASWCDLVPGQNTAGHSELFLQKIDGSGLKQLTHTGNGDGVVQPSLSADGQLVVFASDSDLVAGGNGDGNYEIFLVHADGTGLVQLTHTTGGRTVFGAPGSTHPIFDATATHVVFSSDRDLVPGGNADGNNDLFMMNVDGSGVRQLTFTTGGWGIGQGALDKSGSRVVFDSDRDLVAGQNADGGYEVFVMDTAGSNLAQLTHSDTPETQNGSGFPRWAPDGQSIFFASDQDLTGGNPGANYEAFRMNGDGTAVAQLTSCVGGFGAVPWGVGQQGRAIAIESDCDLVPGANLDRNGEIFLQTWKPAQFSPAHAAARATAGHGRAAAKGAGGRAVRAPSI
jgi:Tol biopolymer transport system component